MTKRILIMGGGLIGASVASHLAENPLNDVHLFESESIVGFHSSGRNAGMLRAVTTKPLLTQFLYESALSLRDWLGKKNESLYGTLGSILAVNDQEFSSYEPSMKLVSEAREITRQEACAMAPLIETMPEKRFLYSLADAVIDVRGLLSTYLQEFLKLGGKLHRNALATKVVLEEGGEIELQTTHGTYNGDFIVNAAGSYAGLVETEGDLRSISFEPRRRTVLVTRSSLRPKPNQPFVWDVSEGFYFRPEKPGFLVCPCDEEILGPKETPPNRQAEDLFFEKARKICPPLANEEIAFQWTGLRTFSPDGNFVLGSDAAYPQYIWAAGLGGHGVTASKKVGECIRDQIEHGSEPENFSPRRFLRGDGK